MAPQPAWTPQGGYVEAVDLIEEFLRPRRPVDKDTYYELLNFYFHEAELLSWQRFEEWLELLDDVVEYVMYSRVNFRKKTGHGLLKNNPIMVEDKATLAFRVRRLQTQFAWGEDPTSRTMYVINNLRAFEDGDKGVVAKMNVVMYRHRRDEEGTEVFPYFRLDVLRRRGDSWKIAKRYVVPIHAVIPISSLSLFY